jgi:hypothetical protein
VFESEQWFNYKQITKNYQTAVMNVL